MSPSHLLLFCIFFFHLSHLCFPFFFSLALVSFVIKQPYPALFFLLPVFVYSLHISFFLPFISIILFYLLSTLFLSSFAHISSVTNFLLSSHLYIFLLIFLFILCFCLQYTFSFFLPRISIFSTSSHLYTFFFIFCFHLFYNIKIIWQQFIFPALKIRYKRPFCRAALS